MENAASQFTNRDTGIASSTDQSYKANLDSSPSARNRNVRRILSFDGGGVRGLASLMILREIMITIKDMCGLPETPRPCEYFDLIGGTSTGGLIALMLGRLGMTVQECIDVYQDISRDVFDADKVIFKKIPVGGNGHRFDHNNLEEAIKKIVKKRVGSDSHLISAHSRHPSCRTFVVAKLAKDTGGAPHLFRSYNASHGYRASCCAIWEAARATTAAPTYFAPMIIGNPAIAYVDSGLGHNNPAQLARVEAARLWPGCTPCIVSIGTGLKKNVQVPTVQEVETDIKAQKSMFAYAKNFIPSFVSKDPTWETVSNFPDGVVAILKMASAMSDLVTNTEDVHEYLYIASLTVPFPYFRFNMDRAVGDIGLGDWKMLTDLSSFAAGYLLKGETKTKIRSCVKQLLDYNALIDPEDVADEVMAGIAGPDEINLDQQIAALLDAVDKNCADNVLQKELADLYKKTTNFEKMIEGWSGLIIEHPEEWKLHNQLTTVFRRMDKSAGENESNKLGGYNVEIETWKKLVIKHPGIWGLQVQLSRAYSKRGNTEEEIDGWTQLVDLFPQEWKLQNNLAQAYSKMATKGLDVEVFGNMEQEIVGWRYLLDRHPAEWEFQLKLAEAFAKKAKMEKVVREWVGLLRNVRSPEQKTIYKAFTILKQKRQETQEAADWLGLVKRHPTVRGLQMQLEIAYAKKADDDFAIAGWASLVERYPTERELAIHLQRAYERKGVVEEEVQGWKSLVSSHPKEMSLQTHLAEALSRLDHDTRTEQEITCWTDLLNTYSDDREFTDRVLHACLQCDNLPHAESCLRNLRKNGKLREVLEVLFK